MRSALLTGRSIPLSIFPYPVASPFPPGLGAMDSNKEFYEQLRLQRLCEEREAAGGLDPYTFKDPTDGTEYEWDVDKKAWFPKITDDFLAMYHANYGTNPENPEDCVASDPATTNRPDTSVDFKPKEKPTTEKTKSEPVEHKGKGEKRKLDQGWFTVEDQRNTNIYVSGLPLDISNDEFVEVMSKCGIIMRDPVTEEYKVKLYKDKDGNLKGDGLCCYLKKESVGLALKLLDEYEIRGYKLHVECATFQLKGEYDATKKRKKTKDYKKKLSMQQKQLDWRPEKKDGDVRKRFERVIIIKNMFHPKDFEEDPLVLNEIREDLRVECEKFGQVKKVLIFDRHPDGVASVAFKDAEEGDACIMALNGRWFGGRKLVVESWDGVTDYQIEETTREREERLKGWDNFLLTNESKTSEGASNKNAANAVQSTKESHDDTVSTNNQDSNNDQAAHREAGDTGDDAKSTDSSIGSSDEESTDKEQS